MSARYFAATSTAGRARGSDRPVGAQRHRLCRSHGGRDTADPTLIDIVLVKPLSPPRRPWPGPTSRSPRRRFAARESTPMSSRWAAARRVAGGRFDRYRDRPRRAAVRLFDLPDRARFRPDRSDTACVHRPAPRAGRLFVQGQLPERLRLRDVRRGRRGARGRSLFAMGARLSPLPPPAARPPDCPGARIPRGRSVDSPPPLVEAAPIWPTRRATASTGSAPRPSSRRPEAAPRSPGMPACSITTSARAQAPGCTPSSTSSLCRSRTACAGPGDPAPRPDRGREIGDRSPR